MREFVYLDEVSLRSLLSSQTGEVTDTRSEQHVEGSQINTENAVGFKAPGFSKADFGSRYQTSNSSTLQTSRKATVQSWFGELHRIDGLRLVEPGHERAAAADEAELLAIKDKSTLVAAGDLQRGALVEFRVRLRADPIFHLGTMMTEFAGIADETPEMFGESGALRQLAAFMPINRMLQRFLAGLIPIRCEALEHIVAEIGGVEYIVRKDSVAGLALAGRPLEIVGVTEHLAYWKDLRRVLFSDAEFTILGRVARTGLQDTWTAIKLGDLFRVVAPDFDEQIATASKIPFGRSGGGTSVNVNELALRHALNVYRDLLLAKSGSTLSVDQGDRLAMEIERLLPRASSATGQRSAFQVVHDTLAADTASMIDAGEDSLMRQQARNESGLSLFPALSNATVTIGGNEAVEEQATPARLLDVEVVAIYW
ncbi:hypothetical protein VPH46_03165 [Sphingomonas sp. MJ1 (PH-R8)]|uniref:DUF6414 family protein n=1 Tax=Sphingomonas sp. MJ1 (PH-R8) TaxID=3112950 RepID=UPI003A8816C3